MGEATCLILIGAFRDVSEADAAVHRLMQTYRLLDRVEVTDAVVLDRKASGQPRIHQSMDEPDGDAEFGLAAGAAVGVIGEFNRSMQHRVVETSVAALRRPQLGSSSRGPCGAGC